MKTIYFLKSYSNNNENSIISVENNIAEDLIKQGIARLATNRDYLVKPITSIKKIVSRAFDISPKIK